MKNIKKTIKFLTPFVVFLMLILPIFVSAQAPAENDLGLIPCDNSEKNPCGFNQFLDLINNVIKFILLYLAVPIAAVMFFYAGVSLIMAQGGEAKTKAKHIFTNAVIGLVFVAASWLIIRTILVFLGYDGGWIGF